MELNLATVFLETPSDRSTLLLIGYFVAGGDAVGLAKWPLSRACFLR